MSLILTGKLTRYVAACCVWALLVASATTATTAPAAAAAKSSTSTTSPGEAAPPALTTQDLDSGRVKLANADIQQLGDLVEQLHRRLEYDRTVNGGQDGPSAAYLRGWMERIEQELLARGYEVYDLKNGPVAVTVGDLENGTKLADIKLWQLTDLATQISKRLDAAADPDREHLAKWQKLVAAELLTRGYVVDKSGKATAIKSAAASATAPAGRVTSRAATHPTSRPATAPVAP